MTFIDWALCLEIHYDGRTSHLRCPTFMDARNSFADDCSSLKRGFMSSLSLTFSSSMQRHDLHRSHYDMNDLFSAQS